MHIISTYTSTLSELQQECNILYIKLQTLIIDKILYHGKVLLMRHLNARTDNKYTVWPKAIVK